MLNVMHQAWCILFLVLAHGSLVAAQPPRPSWVASLPTYVDTNTLHQVVVDYNSGDVFVGGRNVLYHFSSDLKLKHKVVTGPLKDYPGCLIPPYQCIPARRDTDVYVELLKIVDFLGDTSYILLCGSVYNNLCQVRQIDNLEDYHWVHPYNETLGYSNNGIGVSYALLHRGLDGQTSMITATHDVNNKRNSKSAPFLSSKILKKDGDRFHFQYTFQSDRASSILTFKSASSRFVAGEGFELGDFIYFPVVYIKVSTVLFVMKKQESENKLVRFCADDPIFRSYAELPIICNHEGKVMTKLLTAHIGESRKSPDETELYTTFTDDEATGSALCIFPMKELERNFKTYERRCNDDIVGETCGRQMTQGALDFCGPDVRPYICTRTCMAKHFVFVPGVSITVLSVVKQNGELVAIVGPKNGELMKISMSTGEIIDRKLILGGSGKKPYTSPFTFDQHKEHVYLLIRNKVIKYPVASCNVHETCRECFTRGKKDPLGCGWCDGRCAHEQECADPDSFSVDTCTPVIYWTDSSRSPIQGSNTLVMVGDNFGSYVDEAHNSVLVAGIPCTPTFWNNTQVNCTFGSTPTELSGPLSLFSTNDYSSTLGYSIGGSFTTKKNFTYYAGPRLYGIRPSKGPTSGGTLVKLYGQNLDDDKYKKRTVSVHGRLCNIKEFDANTITCTTGYPSSTMNPKDTIALHIDRIVYVLDKHPPPEFNISGLSQTFEYTPDPFITNIRPGFTTVSGSMNLTAFGQHFDSVQFPKLVMKVDGNQIVGNTEFIEDCWTDPQSNGTTMTCRTPSLKDRLVYPTRTQPLMAQVSFHMDGVQGLKDFPKHHRDLSRLLYYPDPEFTVFPGTEKVKKDQKVLQIRGDNLDLVHSTEKLKVKIGRNESCKITRVSSDTLFCNLAPRLFSSNSSLNETNLAVEVMSGSSTHHLGYIELVQQQDPQEVLKEEGTRLWVIVMVAVVVVIFSCVVFMGYKYCWLRKKKPFSIDAFSLANRTAVDHDYRPVPTRAVSPQNDQSLISETVNQALIVPMVPANAALIVPANATPMVPVNAAPIVPANAASMVPVNAAPMVPANAAPMVPVNAAPTVPANAAPMGPANAAPTVPANAAPMVPVNASPLVLDDGAAAAISILADEMSPIVDKDTLFLFADKNLIISNRYLTKGKQIGEGQFGCVFDGYLRHPNETEQTRVAVKTLRAHSWVDPVTVRLFLDEALVMLDFDDHPNVLGLHGVCFDGSGPSIVLPFMKNGDLRTYIIDEKKNLVVAELLKFAVDIAAGMAYLEDNKCLHRDLAARNCLLDQDKNAKVADFGLSRDIYTNEVYDWKENSKTKIPIKWTAPEALKDRKYSSKSDVWSYGVLLWELMTRGFHPYNEVPNYEMLVFLYKGYRLKMPVCCPLKVYKVMLACWNLDPKTRPGFHTLHDCVGYLHGDILRNTRAQPQREPEYVPPEHSVYHDSEDLYLSMAGKPLDMDMMRNNE